VKGTQRERLRSERVPRGVERPEVDFGRPGRPLAARHKTGQKWLIGGRTGSRATVATAAIGSAGLPRRFVLRVCPVDAAGSRTWPGQSRSGSSSLQTRCAVLARGIFVAECKLDPTCLQIEIRCLALNVALPRSRLPVFFGSMIAVGRVGVGSRIHGARPSDCRIELQITGRVGMPSVRSRTQALSFLSMSFLSMSYCACLFVASIGRRPVDFIDAANGGRCFRILERRVCS